jgi:hypothetical protein
MAGNALLFYHQSVFLGFNGFERFLWMAYHILRAPYYDGIEFN